MAVKQMKLNQQLSLLQVTAHMLNTVEKFPSYSFKKEKDLTDTKMVMN